MHTTRDRRIIIERIRRLTPDAHGRWGKMNAPQMLTHLTDAVRMATGELPTRSKKLPIRFFPLKQFVIYLLPFPKGMPTAPELISRAPSEWNGEMDALLAAIERFSVLDPGGTWPVHPACGAMSGREWGVVAYRHFDHHLRQFGV